MNKTLEVIRFEVMRSLKKPSFWIAAILIPLGFALYIGFAAMVGYNTGEALETATDTSDMKLGLYDESGYIKSDKIVNAKQEEQSFEKYSDKDSGIADVKAKKIDVFYYIPANFAESKKAEIYTKPEERSLISDYSTPLRVALNTTALANVSPTDIAVITNAVSFDTTTFDSTDDHVIDQGEIIRAIAGPVVALACFYILMVVLGNRLTAAMVEEKENRISELILTSVKPTTLIVGKIISLMIVGIIQLIVLVVPVLLLYKIAGNLNIFPAGFQLSLDALNIAQYLLYLIAAYFLFTAMSVFVGVISPTAKDANSYSGFMIIMVILPIFFINAFMGEPSALTYFLSYFPPSAPISIPLRAVFGTLAPWEFWVGLGEILVVGALIAKLDASIFRRNAIEFTAKINFKKLFGTPRKTWKK